jgi:hypothetical protein
MNWKTILEFDFNLQIILLNFINLVVISFELEVYFQHFCNYLHQLGDCFIELKFGSNNLRIISINWGIVILNWSLIPTWKILSLNWGLVVIWWWLFHWIESWFQYLSNCIIEFKNWIEFHFHHFGNFYIEFKGWCIKCKFVSIILAIILLNLKANSSNVSIFPIFWGLFHWLLRLIHQVQVYFHHFEECFIEWGLFKFEGWFIKCKFISIILKIISLIGDCFIKCKCNLIILRIIS